MGVNRLTLTLVVWASLVSLASASLATRKETSRLENYTPKALTSRDSRVVAPVVKQASAREDSTDFAVTDETEVLLNGKACQYKDVPNHATILRMEVGLDKKTVLRVYFRTGK